MKGIKETKIDNQSFKLTFLGSGNAFTVGTDNYQSNMILENDKGKLLLIDCGSDIRWSLYDQNLTYKNIDFVYISHLHADHVGGLEWLAFCRKFNPETTQKPVLYISQNIVNSLWNHVLSGGLLSLQGEIAELSSYFKVKPIPENSFFEWSDIKMELVQTIHTFSGSYLVPCYGLFFFVNNVNVLITADTRLSPHLHEFYKKADIIFHDCETSDYKSGVHAHYIELITLDISIKNKMWLYHYESGKLPNAKRDGFRGFVKKGQCFDFSDPRTLG